MKYINRVVLVVIIFCTFLGNQSCKKFVQVGTPKLELLAASVFQDSANANAAMIDIYYNLRIGGVLASGNNLSLSYLTALSADEFKCYSQLNFDEYNQFNTNQIRSNNFMVAGLWSDIYSIIYKANAIIEGASTSEALSNGFRSRLDGEAKFIRAFCYFYLTNLWGDVPLVLTTDYKANNQIAKTSQTDVYQQIVKDLTDSRSLLLPDYSSANGERVRVNKWAAISLLSRVYLYMRDFHNAEIQASEVINSGLYMLEPDVNYVFKRNNNEAIMQLWHERRPNEYAVYFVGINGPSNAAITDNFYDQLEDDLRKSNWIINVSALDQVFHRMAKYKTSTIPSDEYSVVLRLAEQYLIRAEARAGQDKLTGSNSAETDINIIRNRAGLANTTASTKEEILMAIENENKAELFAEWGHRWFDLKRNNRATAILGSIKPDWQSYKELYPIPENQLKSNSKITQNDMY